MRINNRLVKWGNINYALRKSARTYSSRFSILFSLFFLVFSFLISTACLSFPYRIFSRPKEKWEKFELSRLKRIVISLIPLFDNLDVILVKKNHRLIFINRRSCFVSIFFLLFFSSPHFAKFLTADNITSRAFTRANAMWHHATRNEDDQQPSDHKNGSTTCSFHSESSVFNNCD